MFVSLRPFERAITMQKDSAGHVGFIFKDGKINSIVKDSSAARLEILYIFSVGLMKMFKMYILCLL